MECRRTAATGGILRSPSAPASNVPLTRRPHQPHHRRLPYDCDDHDAFNNNVTAATSVNTTATCTTTQLVDELEQLRTDNFQLRLRVYNAERRVDRLSAAVAHNRGRKRCNGGGGGSDSDSSSNGSTDTGSSDNAVANTQTAAAATATAEAAVRTIHDLLTVNRRLLALLAATVSAKAVAVTADDKRRWRRLRNHINKYAGDHQVLLYTYIRFCARNYK